jgi:excisionase family DNA binding protein
MTDWLTVEDIATDLEVSSETVRNWIRKKDLTAYLVGKGYRIKREDYDRFLAKRRTTDDTDDETKA